MSRINSNFTGWTVDLTNDSQENASLKRLFFLIGLFFTSLFSLLGQHEELLFSVSAEKVKGYKMSQFILYAPSDHS